MIIADRHHLLALQAWKRIEQLNMDPIESIRRAIIYATREDTLPYTAADLTKIEAETVLAMGVDPIAFGDLRAFLKVTPDVLWQRLKRLHGRGIVIKCRKGVWQVQPTPPKDRPRLGRPRTLPDNPRIERRRENGRRYHANKIKRERLTPDPHGFSQAPTHPHPSPDQ